MKELISRLEEAASETEFSGVISVFRDASTLLSKAFGYRDIKNKLPNTTSTIFGIASGTKAFTALGIGVLSGIAYSPTESFPKNSRKHT